MDNENINPEQNGEVIENAAEQFTESAEKAPEPRAEIPAKAPDAGRKKAPALIAGGLVLAMLMGFIGSAIGNAVFGKGSTTVLEGQRNSSVIDVAKIDTSKLMTAAEVYAANVNSTVGITTSVTTNFWGFQTTSAASGSGFILTADGYILTNYHVIENSSSINVALYDGTSYAAELIGYDESNDIAVLKIDADGLTPVVLGNSDNLNVGDSVLAIGNPLGELTFSLTAGAVSALNREITLSSGVMMNLIQTDCAINSGNSGGALFNLYGEVVGITNAKYSSSGSEASIDNIGFAIPVNHIRSIVESIIENGYVAKPYIGVMVSDVGQDATSLGLPAGAAVKSVTEDSPAEKAGLRENDIITAVNGEEISGRKALSELISSCSAGDTLKLTVYRQGETISIDVTVGEQIQSALAEEEQQSSQQQGGSISLPDIFGFGR